MMQRQKLFAGLPLASWLGFFAALLAAIAVVLHYVRGKGIDWFQLTFCLLVFAFALAIALRERALAFQKG